MSEVAAAVAFPIESKYDEILQALREELHSLSKRQGLGHPDVFVIRKNIAFVLFKKGKYQEALELYKNIYKIEDKIQPEHQDITSIKLAIADVLSNYSDYGDAFHIYNEVYETRKEVLGEGHPDTLRVLRLMGKIRLIEGRYRETELLFCTLHATRIRYLGHYHADTLSAQKDIVSLHTKDGDIDFALELSKIIYERSKTILGSEDSRTVNALSNVAGVHCLKREYDRAFQIYNEVYEIKRRTRSGQEDIMSTFSQMAKIRLDEGKYDEALPMYKDIYNTLNEYFPHHFSTVSAGFSVGYTFLKQRKFTEALNMFKILREKCADVTVFEHVETLEIQNAVALILVRHGEYDEALSIYENVHEIMKSKYFFGPNHRDILRNKRNVANVYYYRGDMESAMSKYNTILERRLKIFGPEDPGTMHVQYCIALTYKKQGKNDMAFQACYEVYEKQLDIFGENHRRTVRSQKCLEELAPKIPVPKLITATIEGNLNIMKTRVQNGESLNIRDAEGCSPLHRASENSFFIIVKYLLESGAFYNITNKRSETPSDLASNDTTKELFNSLQTLWTGVYLGLDDKVVSEINDREDVTINAKDKNGSTFLHLAAKEGRAYIAKLLLDEGADYTSVTVRGDTCLHIAASEGNTKVATVLVQHVSGNNPEELSNFIDAKTVGGSTALHIAAQRGHTEIIKLLKEYRANYRIRNTDGRMPFQLARKTEDEDLLLSF